MKNLIAIILFITLFGTSQNSSTECLSSRWISLKPTEDNKNIFLPELSFDNELDLAYVIKKYVEDEVLFLYTRNLRPRKTLEKDTWNYINYDLYRESMFMGMEEPHYVISTTSSEPLVDQDGNPIITVTDEGISTFTYGIENYVLPETEFGEIRIREDRVFNEEKKEHEFKAKAIGFYINKYERVDGHEKFWIDLDQLYSVLENKEKYPWYNALINRDYRGFQYKQEPCK